MSRDTEYQFVTADTAALEAQLISVYEMITGVSVQPASPEKLFIQWVTSIIIQERVLTNYTGNQNIPSRAEGENLDALGELFKIEARPTATRASCTERFYISEPQESAVLIPAGTRVTDVSSGLIWGTTEEAYISAGETYADVTVQCETEGVAGNGYTPGQICRIVDLIDFFSKCENITESDGGANTATDDEYYELMRESMDAYSCAGAKGSYVYFAKKASTEIADVIAGSHAPGYVDLYVLMDDGRAASEEIKKLVLESCSADEVRAFTDCVSVNDPESVQYDIEFTYYISETAVSSSEQIQDEVNAAVEEYQSWQSGKLGRDINPSYLYGLLMKTGVKRIELKSPVFTSLRDGQDGTVPQIAAAGSVSVINGGREDE